METYIVIVTHEDGTEVRLMREDELLQALEDENWGDGMTIASAIPDESCTELWGNVLVVIKGHVVQPRPVEKVTKYTFQQDDE